MDKKLAKDCYQGGSDKVSERSEDSFYRLAEVRHGLLVFPDWAYASQRAIAETPTDLDWQYYAPVRFPSARRRNHRAAQRGHKPTKSLADTVGAW